MKFYQFDQNNSGGGFDVDDKICHRLYIQAKDHDEACDIAESMGVYFNGVHEGMDCPCCGDRWYRPWSDEGMVFPYKYAVFTAAEAESLVEKYGCTTEKAEKKYGNRDVQVLFANIESFAQYMADNYGWTIPDGRIFFKDGTVTEINTNKVEAVKERKPKKKKIKNVEKPLK